MIINASPLIIFGKLNRLDILKKLYKNIRISDEVYQEVVIKGIEKNLKDALIIKESINNHEIDIIKLNKEFLPIAQKIELIHNIDKGEAETIALALQLKEKEIIIDEAAAREAAKSLNIQPIGSLRVLVLAYKSKFISKAEIKEILNEMEDSKYRLSPKVLIDFWEILERMK